MHISLLVGLILILIMGEELAHVLITHASEGVIFGVGLLLLIGLAHVACWPLWAGWEWFRETVGPDAAHEVADPICFFFGAVFPFLFCADSMREFKVTRAVFRWIFKRRVAV